MVTSPAVIITADLPSPPQLALRQQLPARVIAGDGDQSCPCYFLDSQEAKGIARIEPLFYQDPRGTKREAIPSPILPANGLLRLLGLTSPLEEVHLWIGRMGESRDGAMFYVDHCLQVAVD